MHGEHHEMSERGRRTESESTTSQETPTQFEIQRDDDGGRQHDGGHPEPDSIQEDIDGEHRKEEHKGECRPEDVPALGTKS